MMLQLLMLLSTVGVGAELLAESAPAGDDRVVRDPLRPVSQIGRDRFELQYFTAEPCVTRVRYRRGIFPAAAFQKLADGNVEVFEDSVPKRWHRVSVTGLRPGSRYFYQVYEPQRQASETDKAWGARDGFRREYAVSTLAEAGKKTVIHLPVKVILMTNVFNPEGAPGLPTRMSEPALAILRREYALATRYFWISSGMRLWVDYQITVDSRWQLWGPSRTVSGTLGYGLPVCRSYPNQDFLAPGGGTFTVFDPRRPDDVIKEGITEPFPFAAQIEQAFPQRYNTQLKRWAYYNSGGGTYGVDEFPRGIPARSQFLGGGDTAWLAAHEFHHGLESMGKFSLSDREDERIVFNHPSPRRLGTNAQAWSTAGRHGEHWDVMAFWDRQLTDAQWLRMYFGRTETVVDADQDGFPDNDPRLPYDEKRFGSLSTKARTDGRMNDLAKVMQSNWAPGPLSTTWVRTEPQNVVPSPTNPDSDGDGLADADDPIPLFAVPPLVPFLTAKVDGLADEWSGIPFAGQLATSGNGSRRREAVDDDRALGPRDRRLTYWQASDEKAYYGCFRAEGDWDRIDLTLDGEGKGVYSGEGIQSITFTRAKGVVTATPGLGGAEGLEFVWLKVGNAHILEFRLPQGGKSPWLWERGGREIGVTANFWFENRGFSLYEPYRPVYFRMEGPG